MTKSQRELQLSRLKELEELRVIQIERAAQNSIVQFANAIDVPGRPVSDDDETEIFNPVETQIVQHHRLILETMDRISKTPHGRVMFFMPPGSAKSTYASVVFPSYFLGAAPNRKVIVASYGDDLTRKFGRRTRSILRQDRYKRIFNCELRSDSQAAQEFSLSNGSEYMSCGIMSGVTGNRANCLLPGSIIETDSGPKAIEHLFDCSFSGNVLSYEHNSKRVVQRRINALARRETDSFYRIICESGAVVEATGDHRFWTDKGWVEARFLAEGDSVLRLVQCGNNKTGIHHVKGQKKWVSGDILRPFMPTESNQSGIREAGEEVLGMWSNRAKKIKKVLLGKLQDGVFEKEVSRAKSHFKNSVQAMRNLWQGISTRHKQNAGSLLLKTLRMSRAFNENVTGGESRLSTWALFRISRCAYCQIVSLFEKYNQRTRRASMCNMPEYQNASCTSYRFRPDEQSSRESSDAMLSMPHENTWCGTLNTESDIVAMVERVCKSSQVYDIQVDGTECFFANGILVHNCIIIDDPIKGREQADSPVIREKTWDAYEDDLKTRLVPGGSIAIIQTRWHESDLAGQILPEDWKGESGKILCRDGNIWEVVCLQARCEVLNDPLGRKFGEYLWPEWFDEKHWAQFQSNKRTWASLYQQLPRPMEGTLFNVEDMLVDGAPVPIPAHCDYVFATIDSAFKAGDKNDGTAVCYFARSRFVGHPLVILDWDIVQIEGDLLISWFPQVDRRLIELSKQCKSRMGSAGAFVEDRGSGIVLLQHGARNGWNTQAIDSKLTALSKDARGVGVSGYVGQGDVKICEYAYNKTVEYKGRTQNHFLTQVFGYRLGISAQSDDLYDVLVYGTAIGCGDSDGL